MIKLTHSVDDLFKNTIYQVITGSTAYGLAQPNSDIDQKAIVIPPLRHLFTLNKEWETQTFHHPDIEFHSLKKALNLFRMQNPTMLEVLYVPEQFIVKQTEVGKHLREHRQLFLSKKCYYSFAGYANDQLLRIKHGLVQSNRSQDQLSIALLEKQLTKYDGAKHGIRINAIEPTENPEVRLSVSNEDIRLKELFDISSKLTNFVNNHSPNKHVKKLDKKLSKHAMHLFRLLHMAIEILETGEVIVNREKDKDFLLAIRNEQFHWSELFDRVDALMERLDIAKVNTQLPDEPPSDQIEQLYFELMTNFLYPN